MFWALLFQLMPSNNVGLVTAIHICINLALFGALDAAVMKLPHTHWWIKLDGYDVVLGLMESTREVWSGDVDFGNGSIESQYSAYCERLNLIDGICCQVNDDNLRRGACHDLLNYKLKSGIVDDRLRLFIDDGTWQIIHVLSNYRASNLSPNLFVLFTNKCRIFQAFSVCSWLYTIPHA